MAEVDGSYYEEAQLHGFPVAKVDLATTTAECPTYE